MGITNDRYLPFKKNCNGKQQQRRSCLAVENEDKGVDPVVKGCLADDEHAGVDHLYDDSNHIRLLFLHPNALIAVARYAKRIVRNQAAYIYNNSHIYSRI